MSIRNVEKRIPVAVTSRGQMTLPSEARKLLGIETPDRLIVVLSGGHVSIEREEMSVASLFGSLPRRPGQPYLDSREEVTAAMEEAAEKLGPQGSRP
ncbi:hypothetical protein BH09CHL1_BH09CHL1_12840 [soil metagenome]